MSGLSERIQCLFNVLSAGSEVGLSLGVVSVAVLVDFVAASSKVRGGEETGSGFEEVRCELGRLCGSETELARGRFCRTT